MIGTRMQGPKIKSEPDFWDPYSNRNRNIGTHVVAIHDQSSTVFMNSKRLITLCRLEVVYESFWNGGLDKER